MLDVFCWTSLCLDRVSELYLCIPIYLHIWYKQLILTTIFKNHKCILIKIKTPPEKKKREKEIFFSCKKSKDTHFINITCVFCRSINTFLFDICCAWQNQNMDYHLSNAFKFTLRAKMSSALFSMTHTAYNSTLFLKPPFLFLFIYFEYMNKIY